ncbi:MAG: hypothetical protein U1U88_001414 [Lawsonella clevelandensis]
MAAPAAPPSPSPFRVAWRPTAGTLEVFGHTKVKHIRESVAIAGVDAIDALDRNIKVRDVLNEHRAWSHGWVKWVARVDDNYRDRILDRLR